MTGRVFGACSSSNNILAMFGEEFERVKPLFGVDGSSFSLVTDNCPGGRPIDFKLIYNPKHTISLRTLSDPSKLTKKNHSVLLT